jgi:hypothetical protein
MINSQYVHFGIKRQCAQIGVENINIFNMKIHYAVLLEIEKHFYKKIYMITLCNFFGIGASHDLTHNISKISYKGLTVFEILQI